MYGGTATVGHLFVYDPATGISTDLGQAVSGESCIYSLTTGNDGKIYGGTGYNGHLFVYDPATGVFTDTGTDAPGWGIYALTTASDGTIYGGSSGGYLFTYNPSSGDFTDLGQAVSGESYIYSLTTASDGKIYGGTGSSGHFFVYNPTTGTFADNGQAVLGEDEVSALTTGGDGKIYGGTRPSGHFFVYDPATDTLTDKGRAVGNSKQVHALVRGSDGKIYGGTGNRILEDGYLFAYDPASHPYRSPGIAVSTDIIPAVRNLANVPQNDALLALTRGTDGKIYAGSGSGRGHLYVYDPSAGTLTDLGQAVSGQYYIYSLTPGGDGKIYGAGYTGHLFVYDPATGVFTDLGQAVSGESYIYSLTTGNDGKIYGGTGWSGHLFVYDPSDGTLTDLGQAVAGASSVDALTTGGDGKIYGGGGWGGRLFVYDPSAGTVTDLGQAVAGEPGIESLTTGNDGKIYGGTGFGHLFVYDPTTGVISDLGQPVGGGEISGLAASGARVYGTHNHEWGPVGLDSGTLFAYDTGSGTTQVIGHPIALAYYAYSLAAGSDGKVYGGTADSSYLFSYDPNYVFYWDRVNFSTTTPSGTGLSVDILSQEGTLLLDNVSSGGSLASISSTAYPSIKLRAEPWTSVVTSTPHLSDWSVTFCRPDEPDEPIAGLAATNNSPTLLGSATTLTATVTAGSNVAYTWAFGDGDTGSGEVATHIYPVVGAYTAAVTASNCVSVMTAATTVTITEPDFYIYLPLMMRAYP